MKETKMKMMKTLYVDGKKGEYCISIHQKSIPDLLISIDLWSHKKRAS